MSRGSTETLAAVAGVVAAVGPVWSIVLTVVLGVVWPCCLVWPGHDPIPDTISELGVVEAPHPVLINVAGFMGLGCRSWRSPSMQ